MLFLRRNSRFPPEVINAYRTNGLLVVLRPVSLKSNILVKFRFFAKKRYFRKIAEFRENARFRTFPPWTANFRPQNLTKMNVFGSGRENSTLEHFFCKKHLFGENREIPPFLQKMQKIAKVASFCAGARNAYRTNGLLTILELILLKSLILAQISEN